MNDTTTWLTNAIVVPTLFGQMIIHRNDLNQSDELFRTGHARDHAEILFLAKLLEQWGTNLTVLDVGAHFGTFSLGLRSAVGLGGRIHAFEPQRIIFNMLAGTIALNGIRNIYCHNVALGAQEGLLAVPQFDYQQPLSFGSIEFSPEQKEPLSQVRGSDPSREEFVSVKTVDGLGLEHVDCLKIDAEGMDLEVIQGARETIETYRPLIFVETIKIDRRLLRALMLDRNYRLFERGNDDLYVPAERLETLNIPIV
jgi:FkbM family methyltransferase